MAKRKLSSADLLRGISSLKPYPAVFTPAQGGFEVIFPNFPKLIAYGVKREQAEQSGVEALSLHLQSLLTEGHPAPRPSDPERLIPDEDEPIGTVLVMLKPDKKAIKRRLGLEPAERGLAMAATLGRLGKPK
jgi:predicted RNase H-like HicB family nuclease